MNRTALLVAVIFGLNIVGKFLGFLRVQQVGAQIGISFVSDALFLALMVAAFWEAFVLSGAAIPTLTSEYPRRTKESGAKTALAESADLLIILLAAASLVSLALYFFGFAIASVLVPGMGAESKLFFVDVAKALSPTPVFATLTLMFAGVNRLHGGEVHFAVSAILINSLSLPVLALGHAYVDDANDLAVAYGTAISAATAVAATYQLLVMDAEVRSRLFAGIFERVSVSRIRNTASHYLPLILPLVAAVAAREINAFVDAGFASTVSEGGIATLGLAERLTGIVFAVLGGAIFVVCEPRWSKVLADSAPDTVADPVSRDVRAIVSAITPVYLVIAVFADDFVQVTLGYGQMSADSIAAVVELVPWLAAAGFMTFLNVTLSRALVFDREPSIVLKVNLVAVAVNFTLDLVLVRYYGLLGVVVATFCVAAAQQLILTIVGRQFRAARSVVHGVWGRTIFLVFILSAVVVGGMSELFSNFGPFIRLLVVSICSACLAIVVFFLAERPMKKSD